MTTQLQEMLGQAVRLSPIERAELVEGILSSFDLPTSLEIDSAWAIEAEDRIDAYDRGDITSVPASMVFEKIEKKYSK